MLFTTSAPFFEAHLYSTPYTTDFLVKNNISGVFYTTKSNRVALPIFRTQGHYQTLPRPAAPDTNKHLPHCQDDACKLRGQHSERTPGMIVNSCIAPGNRPHRSAPHLPDGCGRVTCRMCPLVNYWKISNSCLLGSTNSFFVTFLTVLRVC